jgi:hypothetical protein
MGAGTEVGLTAGGVAVPITVAVPVDVAVGVAVGVLVPVGIELRATLTVGSTEGVLVANARTVGDAVPVGVGELTIVGVGVVVCAIAGDAVPNRMATT